MQFRLTEYGSERFVTVDVTNRDDYLQLDYDLGNLSGVSLLDAVARPSRQDSLWQHTCLELFVADQDGSDYVELNVSTSGNWNCYRFDGYRSGMRESDALKLQGIDIQVPPGRLTVRTLNDLPWQSVLISPSVVVEDLKGQLTYFAVKHGDKPDFHNRDHYVQAALNHL